MSEMAAADPVARVEGLLAEMEALDDPVAQAKATEMVQALLDLYGEGLGRILERVGPEQAVELAIEDAVQRAAPEIERVEAEGTSEPAPAAGPGLLQIEVAPAVRGDWSTVGSLPELRAADTVVKDVAGAALLFAELDESLYAYR